MRRSFNEYRSNMKYIGYVNTAYYIEQLEAFVLSMKQMPCSFIYYDEKGNGQRQNWKLFISSLNSNDTAVLVSFDNAFHKSPTSYKP